MFVVNYYCISFQCMYTLIFQKNSRFNLITYINNDNVCMETLPYTHIVYTFCFNRFYVFIYIFVKLDVLGITHVYFLKQYEEFYLGFLCKGLVLCRTPLFCILE